MTFPVFPGSNPSGYNLSRSLRFRASAGGHLSKTFSTASDQKTFTISNWLKRGRLAIDATFFASVTDANNFLIIYYQASTDKIIILGYSGGSAVINISTSAVFRDPSAWYHVVIAFDTTQATGSNRVKLYINNTQQAVTFTTTPSLNLNALPSTTRYIGRAETAANYFDGYLTEVNFIDGQALTPSSFGSTNTLTGVWQPARYTGTYGTNGFYLPFTDNSALTTSSNVGLGKDFSGNGNYWTTNNISITAGVTYDSMTDVPTLTNASASNYCVLNPLVPPELSTTFSNGNLEFNGAGQVVGSMAMSFNSYFEYQMTNATPSAVGICPIGTSSRGGGGAGVSSSILYSNNGNIYVSGSLYATVASFTSSDIIGVLYVKTSNALNLYKNNVLQASISASGDFLPYALGNTGATGAFNFGQRPLNYTPPTGSPKNLNTYNLPTSTIVKGNTVMDATTYTGTGAIQSITNAGGFRPDLLWIKARSRASFHDLVDSVRGVNIVLSSNSTAAEVTGSFITSLNSNGFTLPANTTSDAYFTNVSGDTMVAWQWQAGQGSSSSNTSGTITSTVSVNATAGFSVVTYTVPSSGSFTVGHGLGVAPSFVIHKSRSNAIGWPCYHAAIGNGVYINLNLTNPSAASSTAFGNTSPTSTVMNYGDTSFWGAGYTYVAYCFAPIAGYSAFGSYTGNGSADGPMIYTGFKPRFFLVKRTDAATDWMIYDTARSPYNVSTTVLFPNDSSADTTYAALDFVSNGIKIRFAGGGNLNISGGNYIYAAFSSNPFKNSLAQ